MDDRLREELADRTLALCLVPSVIRDERRLADEMEAWGRARFAPGEVTRVGHSLVFGTPGRDGRPTVGLFGHLDTVPPHPDDPAPHRTATEVVGLGASDMKSGIAVMQLLAENLPLATLPFNVVFVMYEREEGPYLENGLGPLFESFRTLEKIDFGICLEPSDNGIQLGCCGTLHATITFRGRSAHSARPWQGENAVHKAGPLLTFLASLPPHEVNIDGYLFREVMNVTIASGGRARNVIPDTFTLNLNYRFAPNRTLVDAQEQIRRIVGDAAELAFTDLAPSGPVFANHPLLKHLQHTTGAKTESKQAWTDVARLGIHGIAAVNFGPGESAQAHQARERVPIDQIAAGYRALERFLTVEP